MTQMDTDKKKHRKILLAMRLRGNYPYLYSLLFFFILFYSFGCKVKKKFRKCKKMGRFLYIRWTRGDLLRRNRRN